MLQWALCREKCERGISANYVINSLTQKARKPLRSNGRKQTNGALEHHYKSLIASFAEHRLYIFPGKSALWGNTQNWQEI